eukprot:NODE_4731_length_452_cov_87.600496_g4084_i0.p2 GENE.NODE_4731_length_452_cov_87.600496_g4084_i0~~NODE_4731_length_452_cov_87.600496_g4084_i0.p2  ORF type:complete len:71 (-),score=6.38 NODE_4731_length_452_cov_87.600496_g4084_i0:168-380(-)
MYKIEKHVGAGMLYTWKAYPFTPGVHIRVLSGHPNGAKCGGGGSTENNRWVGWAGQTGAYIWHLQPMCSG